MAKLNVITIAPAKKKTTQQRRAKTERLIAYIFSLKKGQTDLIIFELIKSATKMARHPPLRSVSRSLKILKDDVWPNPDYLGQSLTLARVAERA